MREVISFHLQRKSLNWDWGVIDQECAILLLPIVMNDQYNWTFLSARPPPPKDFGCPTKRPLIFFDFEVAKKLGIPGENYSSFIESNEEEQRMNRRAQIKPVFYDR